METRANRSCQAVVVGCCRCCSIGYDIPFSLFVPPSPRPIPCHTMLSHRRIDDGDAALKSRGNCGVTIPSFPRRLSFHSIFIESSSTDVFDVAVQFVSTSNLLRLHECSKCIAQRNRSNSMITVYWLRFLVECGRSLADVFLTLPFTRHSQQLVSRSNHLLVHSSSWSLVQLTVLAVRSRLPRLVLWSWNFFTKSNETSLLSHEGGCLFGRYTIQRTRSRSSWFRHHQPRTPELVRFTYLVIALFFPTLSQTLTFQHFISIMASAQQKLEYYVSQIDKEVSWTSLYWGKGSEDGRHTRFHFLSLSLRLNDVLTTSFCWF